MHNQVMNYLKKKGFEIVPATEGKKIVYVPYKEHAKIYKYLKKCGQGFSIRFNHNYEIAIFCL